MFLGIKYLAGGLQSGQDPPSAKQAHQRPYRFIVYLTRTCYRPTVAHGEAFLQATTASVIHGRNNSVQVSPFGMIFDGFCIIFSVEHDPGLRMA